MSRETQRPPVAVWDPEQYGVFGDERGRPFFELVARAALPGPRRVVDLGCGSGELTATLAARWPDAEIDGFDSSLEMVQAARAHEIPGRLRFGVWDVTDWRPERPVDLIVANAVLQWVPGHVELFPRWLDALTPDGVLAFQVPGNFDGPSHTILRELCESPRWRDRLGGVVRRDPVLSPTGYLDALARLGCRVDAWETTYAQVLQGHDPVLEWVKGTALRPVLTALSPSDADEFVGVYRERLREAYPPTPYGTVFPFRRVFVVARKHAAP
ncbi:trans-aconitate 2-methyltransferase [Actinomadura logoneensis]|uniref:Trans-aconitate 2-methyltransferase n=1 Tax=Actinomadura logoneensis TaxID=2293572 RepID=A0A372JN68_9ACTN|nr:trans-aconitate 2-methyltransferase [Actinomadura logoneensis]RFU40788.1 trans-aconitate 2-methyltransferase [Actinomadura logoneensis]